jgi:hypothetical protein
MFRYLAICTIVCLFATGLFAQKTKTILQEEQEREKAYQDLIAPMICGTANIDANKQVGEQQVYDWIDQLMQRGTGTWSVNDGYGATCTNDCIITTATSCGQPSLSVFRVPIVYQMNTFSPCSGIAQPTATQLSAQVTMMNDFFACQNIPVRFYEAMPLQLINTGNCTYDAAQVTNMPNIVNIYVFANTGNGTGCNGFAFLPTGPTAPTTSVMSYNCYNTFTYTAGSLNCATPALGLGVVLIHEMGHYLGLHHTHNGYEFGNTLQVPPASPGTRTECPDGSNGCTTGDFIADTNADPDLSDPCANGVGCNKNPAGCPTPCATPYPTDINTENNIMSYNNSGGCRSAFTPCQKAKIVDALLCSRGPQLCKRDVAAEFGANPTNINICVGGPAPTFTATSNCYRWLNGLGATAMVLATSSATFTPPVGTAAGQLNNNVPGVYTFYLGDLNEINPSCRTAVTVTVKPLTGAAAVNGMTSFSITNCSSASTATLTTNATNLGANGIIGWWVTEGNPITSTVTNTATLNTALTSATINMPLANTANHIYQSTTGTPSTTFPLSFNCSTLNPGVMYFATPMTAVFRAAIAPATCTGSSGAVSNITFNGSPGKFTSIAPAGIPCVPNPVTGPPTYTLTVTISGYTGAANQLGLTIRPNGLTGTALYTSFTLAGNGVYTFNQTQLGGFDPGNPGGTTGVTAISWHQTGSGMSAGTVSMALNITYPGVAAIPFPSVTEYSSCLFGTPVTLNCSCSATCPTLSAAPANVSITNSTCQTGCAVSGGVITAPTGTPCPAGSTLQYRVDGAAGTWNTTLPLYTTTAQSIETRCQCNSDMTMVSLASAAVSTVPGTCTNPTAPTISIVENVCPSTTGTISAIGCGAGTTLQWATNTAGPWSTIIPTYTTSAFAVSARCLDNTTGCVSVLDTKTTAPVACVACPTLSAAPANVSITNSTCQTGCAVSGGVITAPTGTPCPTGSTLQYRVDGVAGTWSTTLPTYSTTAQSIETRCQCNSNTATVSPASAAVSTVPGTCTNPTAPTITIVENVCPSTTGTISAIGCGAGTTLQWATNTAGPWSTIIPTYTTSAFAVSARCLDNTTGCISALDTKTTAPVACVACPTLSAAPANVSITNSTCQTGCAVSGGVITAPTGTPCPAGSTLQYRVGGAAGTWSTTLPTYSTTAQSIETRCQCNSNTATVSPASAEVTTAPGTCVPPTVNITSAATAMCVNGTRTLTGTPAGGTFTVTSGPGTITFGVLTATGAGTIALSYAYTDAATGCVATPATQSITVNALPTANITSSNSAICVSGIRSLVGTPAGGTFTVTSGPGTITSGVLTATGAGTIALSYAYTDAATGCVATPATQSITVNALPTAPVVNITNNICPAITGTIAATGCGAGTITEFALAATGPWTTVAPTYTATAFTVFARCVNSATGCISPVASAITAPVACCPTLATAPANVTITTNSSCQASCAVSGGVIAAPTGTPCPAGSALQYRVNAGAWSATLPTYTQAGPAQSIETRCQCTNDAAVVSPVSAAVVTVPSPCITPTLFTVSGGGVFCAGGTPSAITLSGSQNGALYQLLLNGAISGGTVAGTGSPISFGAQSLVGTYTVSAVLGTCTANMTSSVAVSTIACGITNDPSIADPCTCKNNATTLTNGQFDETIEVTAPTGQTWTVVGVTGLFTTASATPPAAPTPLTVGTTMTFIGGTTYRITGIHIDAQGYSLSVSNGLGTTLTVGNTCAYPNPVLALDNSIAYCSGSPAVPLTGTPGDANITTQGFTVDGVAATQFNPAALASGSHTVTYTVNGGIPKAVTATDPGCIQSVSKTVQVATSAPANLSCLSNVNISLDQSCAFIIPPSMLLTGFVGCDGDYSVSLSYTNGGNPFGNTVSQVHLNQTLFATVKHTASGNSCWGQVFVEDKTAPTLTCTDITVACNAPIPAMPPNNGNANVIVSDNCGTHTLSSVDVEQIDLACTDVINGRANISYAIRRTHSATDAQGNISAPCTQWIYFQRLPITPLTVGIPVDITLNGCNADTTPANTGRPSVGGGFCEASVSFLDQVIPVCDGTRKIVRTWTILNWCAPAGTLPLVGTQIIKVEDRTEPSFVNFPNDVTISTEPNSCNGSYNLPDVLVDDACSRLASIKAIYAVNGTPFVLNGSFPCYGCPVNPTPGCGWPAPYTNNNNCWATDTLGVLGTIGNLPIGTHEVTYVITDDCGNTRSQTFKVTVADLIPPTAICDKNTIASLNIDGSSFIDIATFDDGTFDNCAPVFFKARRMDAGCGQSTDFHDQVKFCCTDQGQVVTVVFRAYDANPGSGSVSQSFLSDRSNDCMVQVEVQDKLRPTCTAPANVTVSCKTFDPSYWSYGTATATDNCGLDTITVSIDESGLDKSCKRGIVRRTWTAKDDTGLESRCTQKITITYQQDYFVHFPADVKVNDCTGSGIYGEPKIFRKDCELIATTFTDDTLKSVPGACYQILRTWKVINWCTFNPNTTCTVVPNPLGDNGVVKVTPYASNTTDVPADSVSTSASIILNAPTVDFNSFWSADANCYEYTQVISIIDSQKPTIDGTAAGQTLNDVTDNSPMWYVNPNFNDPVHNIHDLCEGQPDLNITASDLCTGTNLTVRYILFLDTDGDGTMETVVNSFSVPEPGFLNIGNVFNPNYAGGNPIQIDLGENFQPIPGRTFGNPIRNFRYKFDVATTVAGGKRTARVIMNTIANSAPVIAPQLPYGRHKIKWLVADNCGNEETREYFFSIRDAKAPTVVCAPIAVNIMPTQMIDIWDTELLQYTVDNCTPTAQLETAICRGCTSFPLDANGQPVKAVRFTCSDIGTQPVRIWSRDKSTPRNADYCETTVLVQDNIANVCPVISNKHTVAGTLSGVDKNNVIQGLPDATVTLQVTDPATGSTPAITQAVAATGLYNFVNAVPTGANAVITPSKNTDPLNGVNMLDVLKIQRHILGLEPLSSNYRQIAADVNNTRSITSSDMTELRKLILGAYSELPAVASWRFVDRQFTFPNAYNAFATVFPESISLQNVQQANTNLHFEAIKTGDVTGDATYNNFSKADDRTGEVIYLQTGNDTKLAKGQLVTVPFTAASTLDALQFTLALQGLELVETNLPESMFAVHTNALTIATDAVQSFTFTFRATQAGTLSKMMSLSSRITSAMAFRGTSRADIAFQFQSQPQAASFELYQNAPNPFTQATVIGFYLPKAAKTTLTIHDDLGRVLHVQTVDFGAGQNAFTVERSKLSTSGLLFYTVQADAWKDTKTMVVFE